MDPEPSPPDARRKKHVFSPALELAVVGTDIREDSRRYSVFIVEVLIFKHHLQDEPPLPPNSLKPPPCIHISYIFIYKY